LALAVMTTRYLSSAFYLAARAFRATGVPRALAGRSRFGFAMGMLAATRAHGRSGGRPVGASLATRLPPARPPDRPTAVVLFLGCVMDGLFSHVHDATVRTLTVNGYDVVAAPEQVCCGALHAHAGLQDSARSLARANVAAFADGIAPIVVNSAGCGAQLKAYGHVLGDSAAADFVGRIRDVTELLAERGPVAGAPLKPGLRVAYDAPCHLAHAQRIIEPPLAVLGAIPGLDVTHTADSAQCCGSAGLYTLLESALSRDVLAPKIAGLVSSLPDVVATGNPGCLMQIGGGLLAAGTEVPARHPVELLDASYRAAGFYA
jgi:glycolate oxidase iron-sulfur subunit